MPTVIHAELKLTDCSGELWLNGIPLPGQPARRPVFEFSVPVNHLLVTGMNDFALWVDVDGKPSENKALRRAPPNPAAVAVARLVAYDVGVMAAPENGKVLATFEYRGATNPRPPTGASPRPRASAASPWTSASPSGPGPGRRRPSSRSTTSRCVRPWPSCARSTPPSSPATRGASST